MNRYALVVTSGEVKQLLRVPHLQHSTDKEQQFLKLLLTGIYKIRLLVYMMTGQALI